MTTCSPCFQMVAQSSAARMISRSHVHCMHAISAHDSRPRNTARLTEFNDDFPRSAMGSVSTLLGALQAVVHEELGNAPEQLAASSHLSIRWQPVAVIEAGLHFPTRYVRFNPQTQFFSPRAVPARRAAHSSTRPRFKRGTISRWC